MIKVLYISTDGIQSGAGLCMLQQICYGKEQGIDYQCILPCHGNLEDVAKRENIAYKVIRSYPWLRNKEEKDDWKFFVKWIVKSVLNIKVEIQIYYIIKKQKIDIVHINTICSGVGAKAAHIAKVPVVWHFREFVEEDFGSHYINKRKSIKLIKKSAALIAVSEAVKNKYEKYFGKRSIYRIYDGLDINKFYCPEKEIFASQKKAIILMAGHISDSKGQSQLLKAVACMTKEEQSKLRVQFAGVGNDKTMKKIKEFIKRYELENVVEMLGFREDIDDLWKQADICVVCSRFEAFGRVTVEAMLSGCLVIGTDRGGTIELIQDGVTGYLYPYGEVDILKKKILEALERKEEARKVAKLGRKYAKEHFDSKVNAENIKEVYKKICKNKR